MTAEQMRELTETVLARFAADVAAASDLQLAHLAERVEACPPSSLCNRQRALVDAERARRGDVIWVKAVGE